MKKHILKALTLLSVTAMLLSGCGNQTPPNNTVKNAIATQTTEAPTEAPAPELTPAPTIAPTEAPTPEPTQEPTPEPTEDPLPEDRAWIDDIYNMFMENDSEGLLTVLMDADLAKKAAPYEYAGWSYLEYETAYRLVTTDGKIIGLILYDENGYFSNNIFYCEDENRNYGFKTIETGDKLLNCYKNTRTDEIMHIWYDGELEYYSDGNIVDPATYGGYLLVWQM